MAEQSVTKRPRLLVDTIPITSTRTTRLFEPQQQDNDVSLFRLEYLHKEGSNEHRYLIFSTQRRGAIAKIVFRETSEDTLFTIHVLECKPEYRKCGFGSLLLFAALQNIQQSLQQQQHHESIVVQLDAEEDERRHQKLVQYYASFGFELKPGAKITYLNNNCFEVYRKVPMRLNMGRTTVCERRGAFSSCTLQFSPMTFRTLSGDSAIQVATSEDTSTPKEDWMIHWLEQEPKRAVFRTTRGSNLAIERNDMDGSMFCCLSSNSEELHPFFIRKEENENAVKIQSVSTGEFLVMDRSRLQCSTKVDAGSHWEMCKDKEQPHRLSLAFLKARPLRDTCFFTAEAARSAGLPDWLQLVALLYHKVAHDEAAAAATEESQPVENIAPKIPDHGRIVFQHNWSRELDRQPEEDDIADCVAVLRRTTLDNHHHHNETVVDCGYLWKTHYAHICEKYGVSQNASEWYETVDT